MFIIKHAIDNRYEKEMIASHNRVIEECHPCTSLVPLIQHPKYRDSKVVIIDEAQFFDDLVDFVKRASDIDKKTVVVYGLNADFERKPFKNISEVQALANEIEKLKAYCCFCKDSTLADYTLRTCNSKEQIVVGTDDIYQPVCRKHYLQHHRN